MPLQQQLAPSLLFCSVWLLPRSAQTGSGAQHLGESCEGPRASLRVGSTDRRPCSWLPPKIRNHKDARWVHSRSQRSYSVIYQFIRSGKAFAHGRPALANHLCHRRIELGNEALQLLCSSSQAWWGATHSEVITMSCGDLGGGPAASTRGPDSHSR